MMACTPRSPMGRRRPHVLLQRRDVGDALHFHHPSPSPSLAPISSQSPSQLLDAGPSPFSIPMDHVLEVEARNLNKTCKEVSGHKKNQEDAGRQPTCRDLLSTDVFVGQQSCRRCLCCTDQSSDPKEFNFGTNAGRISLPRRWGHTTKGCGKGLLKGT